MPRSTMYTPSRPHSTPISIEDSAPLRKNSYLNGANNTSMCGFLFFRCAIAILCRMRQHRARIDVVIAVSVWPLLDEDQTVLPHYEHIAPEGCVERLRS